MELYLVGLIVLVALMVTIYLGHRFLEEYHEILKLKEEVNKLNRKIDRRTKTLSTDHELMFQAIEAIHNGMIDREVL